MVSEKPRVLIEDWLPFAQVGAESQRERGASSALPPLYFLHVWWARRPLTVSRAAILGSLLPAWSEDWPEDLHRKFPTRDAYHEWFLKLLGILGDPAATRKRLIRAKEEKVKLEANPYGYSRAFTYNPHPEQVDTVQALLRHTWGTVDPVVMDCFAGGGSIPFESLRYGFTTYANELNPVASVILKATLDYPLRFGSRLGPFIREYGKVFADTVQDRLAKYFPIEKGESIHAYVWARTVACPYTGKSIPLSPNWWLLKGPSPVAVLPAFPSSSNEPKFVVVKGRSGCAHAQPDRGTTSRTGAVSPWQGNQIVSLDYLRAEAQAGRMGEQLYAVAVKRGEGIEFRAPTSGDIGAVQRATHGLAENLDRWEQEGVLPIEAIRAGDKTDYLLRYGMKRWCDLFSPRQLLSLCTAAEVYREVCAALDQELEPELARAIRTYLAMVIDKAADYNSRLARWHSGRGVVANTFDRHDFGFKWSYAEFDAAHNLFRWAVGQVADAAEGIASLVDPDTQGLFASAVGSSPVERLQISKGSSADLVDVADASVGGIIIDPPYYDNVHYAELSDFFYVWQKRSIGLLWPRWFEEDTVGKDEEAIANPGRFRGVGNARVLAEQDYERKMEGCFREMYRVLKDDGVLTVMFTHKKVEAWDTLGASLINAGFAVHASWPVHTESEHSLHQAKKNAAASTILLSCRKRVTTGASVWWDDLKARVRETARGKAEEYETLGIRGVDLYIATFGPVLSVISEHWPVLTSEVDPKTNRPKPLRPEAALEIAREEVVSLRKRGLLLGREVRFDPVTDWYLLAWDAFRAEQFPADEARKLCIALDIELEKTVIASKKLVTKKGKNVVLVLPKGRRKRGMVDPDAEVFDSVLDTAHTAMLIFEEDGAQVCGRWLRERGLDRDRRFLALLQAMVNAIPVTKKKGQYIRPEMALLDGMNDALGLGITIPVEAEPELQPQQASFFAGGRSGEEEDMEEDEGDVAEDDEEEP
jgi:adenine-specific DNA methylase